MHFINKLRNSKFRHFILPIRSYEFGKFILMASLMFCILLNQNLVRNIKDSVVVTMIGTEILSFIKLWCEMPAGMLFIFLYTRMCNKWTTENIFRIIVLFFLSFFLIFAFFIFPNVEFLHQDSSTIEHYVTLYPNIKWFIVLFGKWSFVLFYIMGELWPIIVYSTLFWQFVNKINSMGEARRFYVFFNIVGQANLFVSGSLVIYLSKKDNIIFQILNDILFKYTNNSDIEIIIKTMITVIVISGLIILFLHRMIELKDISNKKQIKNQNISKDIMSMNFRESIKMIFRSKVLLAIAALVICYSTAINLIEGVWMSRAKALYPSTSDFMIYHASVLQYTGISTILFAIFGSGIVRYFGWAVAAVITPVILGIFGSIFFIFVLGQDKLDMLQVYLFGKHIIPAIFIVVFAGSIQNIFAKGAKYALFDATKEMVYVSMDNEMKTKGKAAIDTMGAKIGKSLGAMIQFVTFSILPSANHEDIAGFLMVIFVITCITWVYSVFTLKNYVVEPEANNA